MGIGVSLSGHVASRDESFRCLSIILTGGISSVFLFRGSGGGPSIVGLLGKGIISHVAALVARGDGLTSKIFLSGYRGMTLGRERSCRHCLTKATDGGVGMPTPDGGTHRGQA